MRKSQNVSPRRSPIETLTGRLSKTGLVTPRNIQDFSPLEQFQKQFAALGQAMLRLRQMNPPPDVERIFTEFQSLQKKSSLFIEACQKVLKHNKLGPDARRISKDPFDIVANFTEQSNGFFSIMVEFNKQKPKIFAKTVLNYVQVMDDAILDLEEICMKEQPKRCIFKEYSDDLRKLMKELRNGITRTFKGAAFEGASQEDMSVLIETAKRLSRKFEQETVRAFYPQRAFMPTVSEHAARFHAGFVALVPLLGNIPAFNDVLIDIFESVEDFSDILKSLIRETRVIPVADPISVPVTERREVMATQEVDDNLFRIDPVGSYLGELAQLFGCSNGRECSRLDWCHEIVTAAKRKLRGLEESNHALNTKLQSNEDITSEAALTERFEENRRYQESVAEGFARQKDGILRQVVDTVKVLVPRNILHPDDDFMTQIRTLVTNCKIHMDDVHKKLDETEQMVAETKDALRSFYKSEFYKDIDETKDLKQTADVLITKLTKFHKEMDQKLTRADPSQDELNTFLKFVLADRIENLDELTLPQLKKELINFVAKTQQDLEDTKTKLSKCEENRKQYEEHVIDCILKVRTRIGAMTRILPDVTKTSFEEISNNVSEILAESEKKAELWATFRKFFCSFLSQLRYALKLPPMKLMHLSDDELKDVMTAILDCPPIQKGLGRYKERASTSLEPMKLSEEFGSPKPVTRYSPLSTKDADPQFVFKVHNFLAECCGQLQGCSPSGFMHVPVEKLMTNVNKLIFEKNDFVKNLRGLLADIAIRVNGPDIGQKEALMKRDLPILAKDIFSGLDPPVLVRDGEISEKIPELVSLIPPQDMQQFRALELKPLDCVEAELNKISTTFGLVEPLLTLIDGLAEDISANGSFAPLSPNFRRYLDQIENIRRASVRLSPQEVHPCVYPFINKAVSLITLLSATVSSMSIAESYANDQQNLTDLILNRQENDMKIRDLTAQIAEQSKEYQQLQTRFRAFVEASRKMAEVRHERMREIHQKEIAVIVDHYCQSEF